jgi:thiamine-phosphate diphosphorylase / hydroxyethylthiazole kinase
VAVVSAIMAAPGPQKATADLLKLIKTPPTWAVRRSSLRKFSHVSTLFDNLGSMIKHVAESKPLCHNMTNTVVQNIAANVAIAIGASPIMSECGAEAEDLAKLKGSLVINMGTVTPSKLENYLQAITAYNVVDNPVIFDPVGAGATQLRRDATRRIINHGYFDVIKGNEGEILCVARRSGQTPDGSQQRGVDSSDSGLNRTTKAALVASLAAREKCIVVMTGEVDFISDGTNTVSIANGHPYLGLITGSGCTLGTTIGGFLAAHRNNGFTATIAAMILFEIAAENAAATSTVKGPGSFVPAWIDQLYFLSQKCCRGDFGWLEQAKVEIIESNLQ